MACIGLNSSILFDPSRLLTTHDSKNHTPLTWKSFAEIWPFFAFLPPLAQNSSILFDPSRLLTTHDSKNHTPLTWKSFAEIWPFFAFLPPLAQV
ncbi:hypothetical protein K1719_010037 [Acacia pycnantha]|nr:hypothetical protein K1719_010037 [Acacia pycnantha]